MKIVYSEQQQNHNPTHEMHCGELVPFFETPKRVRLILQEIARLEFGEIIISTEISRELLQKVHAPDYLHFVELAHSRWQRDGKSELSLFPHVWRAADMSDIVPTNLFGQLGYYSFDVSTPITENTWAAALASASSAAYAAGLLLQDRDPVFALCRPPGHHAGRNYFGGYCFLNNAALAAQQLVDATGKKVAILDVDYHHGNGTQSIFYDRADVFVASIHANPKFAYPYFAGHANERGFGEGVGFNLNVPMPENTAWESYSVELESVLEEINKFSPDFLVVSLGVDTYENDPISKFKFATPDFFKLGTTIAGLDKPTLFVMEGGYAIEQIGPNVLATLQGFEGQAT